jgi:hypothetical protein
MFVSDPRSVFFPSRIPDPNLFHPGSASKNLSVLTKKKWFLSTQKYDSSCSSPIFFYQSRMPDLGSRGQKGTGSRIRIRKTEFQRQQKIITGTRLTATDLRRRHPAVAVQHVLDAGERGGRLRRAAEQRDPHPPAAPPPAALCLQVRRWRCLAPAARRPPLPAQHLPRPHTALPHPPHSRGYY